MFPVRITASIILIAASMLLLSCANQLPPSGGADDKSPPKIISVYPRPDEVNFRGNFVRLKFNEYADRRSFEESFLISPAPPGEMNFNWGGNEVEIEFSKGFEKNRTYVMTIGNGFMDLRGGNRIASPFTFAFSTGNKIDKGKISGRIVSGNYDRVKIFAYNENLHGESKTNPEKNHPDYMIQPAPDGSFEFLYLPAGKYRLYAVDDQDRNNLYNSDVDKISNSPGDVILSADSSAAGIDFALNMSPEKSYGVAFIKSLSSDSINFIYSDIEVSGNEISPLQKFHFYFRDNTLSKSDIVNNFSMSDTVSGKKYRPVFNWINDSLLEVFSPDKFSPLSNLTLTFDLTNTALKYLYTKNLKVGGKNSFGTVSGKIVFADTITSPVYLTLLDAKTKTPEYFQRSEPDLSFRFEDVREGEYELIAFIDENDNGRYDTGNYFPYVPSEKLEVYPKGLKVKGGWNVDNVFVEF